MSIRSLLIAFLLAVLIIPMPLRAQQLEAVSRHIVLYAVAEIDFEPVSGYIFLSVPGHGVRRLDALLVPPYSKNSGGQSGVREKWLAGLRVQAPPAKEFSYTLLLVGERGEAVLKGPFTRQIGDELDAFNSVEELHQYITRQKADIEEARATDARQSAELKGLRSDVDLITDINRLVEVREESLALEKQIQDLDKDFSEYNHSLSLVNSYSVPKNVIGREAELAAQIVELNAAIKSVEEKERKARDSGPTSIERKQALIDETKDEDEQSLVRKLAGLRRERRRFEAQ